jgi:hypothetical protein
MGWEDLARIDVEKSSSHQLSQIEIASDNPCAQHLSGNANHGGVEAPPFHLQQAAKT